MNQNFTAEELVKEVFLKTGCENVSNITSINNGLAVGYFEGGIDVLGFDDGVIISSGDINLAEGPNEDIETTFAYGALSNDPDMESFAPGIVYDVGGIEFDFTPVTETVTFEYAFASEEYCEFVNSIFNDVFGFFVSGPGINGPYSNNAINVALVPGTTDFVAINSINRFTNPDLYIPNELFVETDECDVPFIPTFLDLVEYDGLTVELTATIDVIPCETYHIRLLVADVGDDILDSGVFLKAKSFDLSGDISITAANVNGDDPNAVEGCQNGKFIFARSGSTQNDLTIDFSINTLSTATSGDDYVPLPTSIVIPAGEESAELIVEIIDDGIPEATESISLETNFPCDCIDPVFATLFIDDLEGVSAESGMIEVCSGQDAQIEPVIIGGTAPYSFEWSNGSTASPLSVSVTEPTTFLVTITDACSTTAEAEILVNPSPLPTATLSGYASFCESSPSFLEINFEGNPPWEILYSINGVNQPIIADIFDSPYLLPVDSVGFYTLDFFNDATCAGQVSGGVEVTNASGELSVEVTPSSCFKTEDGAISWSIIGGEPPFVATWSPSVDDPNNPVGLLSGNYDVTITGQNGCQLKETINVPTLPGADCEPFDMYIPNAFSPNGDGFNDEFRFYPADESNIVRVKSLHIFNRWGDLMLEKEDFFPSETEVLWDGTFNGEKMNVGIYVYQAILELGDGKEEVVAGDLLLLK